MRSNSKQRLMKEEFLRYGSQPRKKSRRESDEKSRAVSPLVLENKNYQKGGAAPAAVLAPLIPCQEIKLDLRQANNSGKWYHYIWSDSLCVTWRRWYVDWHDTLAGARQWILGTRSNWRLMPSGRALILLILTILPIQESVRDTDHQTGPEPRGFKVK